MRKGTRVSGEIFAAVLGLVIAAIGCRDSRTVTLPKGTKIVITPNTTLSTQHSRMGTEFTATVLDEVVVNGERVLWPGVQVRATLTEVWCPDRTPGPGRLTVAVTAIEGSEGGVYPLMVNPISIEAAAVNRADLERLAAEAIPGVAIEEFTETRDREWSVGTVRLITKGDHVALEPGRHLVVFTAASVDLPAAWTARD